MVGFMKAFIDVGMHKRIARKVVNAMIAVFITVQKGCLWPEDRIYAFSAFSSPEMATCRGRSHEA